jgi:hypothetical protein
MPELPLTARKALDRLATLPTLPAMYDHMTREERARVREEYARRQGGICPFCLQPLTCDPPMAQLPRVIYGDLKLLAHFRRMQEMAAQFVTPEPYQGFTPGNAQLIVGDESVDRGVFISDMIYMLDGPEQRDAQREAEGLRTQPPPA